MNGFRAFQYYISLKIHFTRLEFSVFKNKGFLKGSYETFLRRQDYQLYESLARKYPEDRTLIQFLACNMMYNHFGIVYDMRKSEENFVEYQRRRQSITKIFTDDLYYLLNNGIYIKNPLQFAKSVLDFYIGKKITLETVRILDDCTGNTISLLKNTEAAMLFSDDLLRLEKAKGFVKYDINRITPIYMQYLQE